MDFEDGVVERFDSLSPYDQYSEAGIGFAWKSIDGVKTKVLVHADGLVIPMWAETEAAPDLLLHPVWRQAWIFGVEEHPTPDPFDDPQATELRSVYIHWTDLREPPPSGPKVVLPFALRFDPRVINNEDRSVHGPRPKQQADVPFVLSGDLRGCAAVELDRNGGFHCRWSSYTTLAEGWSYASFEDENFDAYVEFQNRETGEVQIIRGEEEGDDCSVTHTVMEPPRAVVVCDGHPRLVWAPTKTIAYPSSKASTGATTSADQLLFSSSVHYEDGPREADHAHRWVDLEQPSVTAFAQPQMSREHVGYPYRGGWLFTGEIGTWKLYGSRSGETAQRAMGPAHRCPRRLGFADWHLDSILLACWGPPPNPQSIVGFDPDLASTFQLPGADSRESLLTATHVLSTRRGQGELVVWRRSPAWPTSSRD